MQAEYGESRSVGTYSVFDASKKMCALGSRSSAKASNHRLSLFGVLPDRDTRRVFPPMRRSRRIERIRACRQPLDQQHRSRPGIGQSRLGRNTCPHRSLFRATSPRNRTGVAASQSERLGRNEQTLNFVGAAVVFLPPLGKLRTVSIHTVYTILIVPSLPLQSQLLLAPTSAESAYRNN